MNKTYVITREGLHTGVTDEVSFADLGSAIKVLNDLLSSSKYKVKSFDERVADANANVEQARPTNSGRTYSVYVGRRDGKVVYVGTTIQKPQDRWRWHKANGKDLDFELVQQCTDENEMLTLEYELIKKYNPKMNKIKNRKQNLNAKLTPEVLQSRHGDSEWCQCCYRRRVRPGYKVCYYCQWEPY